VPADPGLETDGTPVPEMTVTFLGVAGTGGILPWHYTQSLIDLAREKDFGLRDFLDLFNHRLIANFYRAWKKCHFYVGYELSRRSSAKSADSFTQILFSLAGMGTGGLRDRQAVSDEMFLYYSGYFARRPRPAVALEQIVTEVFHVPVHIQQFQGQWMYLRRQDQTQLRPGGNNLLGVSAIAGRRTWGIENKIRLRVGPLSHDDFQTFLPGGSEFVSLAQIVRSFAGPAFDFDLQLVISKDEVPPCQLNRAGGVRLGWNAWMFSKRPTRNLEDAVFACEGLPSR
jgi:type VI secretion system protein ImpH